MIFIQVWVTEKLVAGCPKLLEMIKKRATNHRRYLHEKQDESNIAFKMIRDDVPKVCMRVHKYIDWCICVCIFPCSALSTRVFVFSFEYSLHFWLDAGSAGWDSSRSKEVRVPKWQHRSSVGDVLISYTINSMHSDILNACLQTAWSQGHCDRSSRLLSVNVSETLPIWTSSRIPQ